MSFFVSVPAYLFGGTAGTHLSAINLSVQAVPLNQQHPVTYPGRNARQVHVTTAHRTEQNPTSTTWQKVQLTVFFLLFRYVNCVCRKFFSCFRLKEEIHPVRATLDDRKEIALPISLLFLSYLLKILDCDDKLLR